MAVKVGELFALLKVDDAQFKRALKDAETSMEDLAKKSGAAFAAVVGGMTAATVAAGRYADEMNALSGQTGLAVESVQALGFAAMKFDSDLATLGTSMRAFVRRSAEAAQGNESFLKTFTQLGISRAEVQEGLVDIEGLLLLVADRISGLTTEAERSAAAMNLLGDAGRQLVPFLSEGAQGIRAAMKEARQLGIVTGRDSIQALSQFTEEWDVLRTQLAATGRTLAVEFTPTLRAGLQLISQGAEMIANLSEETRALVGVIGSGTIGAVGSFAALTTTIWATTRAVQTLGTTLKLASGPAGWIALAASAAVSLAAGFGLASAHAKSARQAIIDLGDTETVTKELEKVREEIKELQEAASPDFTTPVEGGPQMRFFAEGQYEKELAELREQERALVARLEEIAEQERQREKLLDSLQRGSDVGATTESESFRRWQYEIANINRELDLYATKLIEIQPITDANTDQAQYRRAIEQEAVQLLEAELRTQEAIAKATREALADSSLLPQEASELNSALEMAEATSKRLRHELTLALDALALTDYATPFERLNAELVTLRLRFLTGVAPVENLNDMAQELLARVEGLNDGTDTWLQLLQTAQAVAEQISDALPSMEAVTPGRPSPPSPMMTRDEARLQALLDQFGLLELRVDASLVPMQDAIGNLHELRAALIALVTEGGGSLAEANEEQLQLYIRLTSALDRWMDSLQALPTRLEEIRAEMQRSLGVGMAVEREITLATGGTFDPIAFEMGVLQSTLREMGSEVGTVTPEMEELARRLRELADEQENLATTGAMVRAALDGVGRNLGPIGRALSGAVTFDPSRGLGSFGFDAASFMTSAIGLAADLLFNASSGLGYSAEVLERAAQTLEQASRSWDQTLSEGQFHELAEASPDDIIADLKRQRAEAQNQIAALEKRWMQFWNAASRGERIRELEDTVREINTLINDLRSNAGLEVERRLEELIGVTMRNLQGAVAGAFSASTAEDFAADIENSLEARVRSAFVTAFLESAAMAPLFDALGDSIREAVMDSDISPGEMSGIRSIMEQIEAESQPLYDLLDEFDLLADTTERVNSQLRNVPAGFKAALSRFQVAEPVPLATGGIVTRPTLAVVGEAGPEAVIPLSDGQFASGAPNVVVDFRGSTIYGMDDFERRVEQAVSRVERRNGMAAHGVVVRR